MPFVALGFMAWHARSEHIDILLQLIHTVLTTKSGLNSSQEKENKGFQVKGKKNVT